MEIIFSPSFVYQLAHTVSAFYVTTAFVVLGVAAYTFTARSLRRGRASDVAAGALVPRDLRAPTNGARGHARPQHLEISARQARGYGGVVGYRARRAGIDHRLARCARSATTRRSRSEARQPLSHPFVGRRGQGAEELPPDERPPVSHRLFRLQDHGRHRCCDVRNGRLRTAAVVAAARGHDRLVSETLSARFSARVHCRHRRMDNNKKSAASRGRSTACCGRAVRSPFPHRARCAAVPPCSTWQST